MSYGFLAHIRFAGDGILDAVDAVVSNFMLPIGGVLVALFVGWRMTKADALHESDLSDSWFGRAWLWLLRVVVPVTIFAILLQSASAL